MKKLTKQLVVAAIIACLFSACGITTEDILKKYDTYSEAGTDANKAGISIQMQATGDVVISYGSSLLNTSEENMQKLSRRWFVADAENPGMRLPAGMEIAIVGISVNDTTQPVTYEHHLILKAEQIKERFLLIGFEGIASLESKDAETLPLFFLVENKEGARKILTSTPRLAGDLFPVNYTPAFFTAQDYSGEISFANSKNVVLHLTLSADLKKITQLKLSVETLTLTPANFDKQRKNSKQESIFKFLKNSIVKTNFAIEKVNGYNVMARDADGYPAISTLQFNGGGFEATSPIAIIEGKITLNERPLICDLTVTNACVYGTIKIEMNDCGTPSTYAVFKNITTPQDIPGNILK